jgi:hypothetical protein
LSCSRKGYWSLTYVISHAPQSRFTDPKASADQLAEAVELLICLKHDPEMLCDNYLNGYVQAVLVN